MREFDNDPNQNYYTEWFYYGNEINNNQTRNIKQILNKKKVWILLNARQKLRLTSLCINLCAVFWIESLNKHRWFIDSFEADLETFGKMLEFEIN